MNKKGFTLIELIAVVIVLGILMIIAIPSVSTLVDNSRKKAYLDIAQTYVDAVRKNVSSRTYIIKKDGKVQDRPC